MPAPLFAWQISQKYLQNATKILINEPFCAIIGIESQGGSRDVIYCRR